MIFSLHVHVESKDKIFQHNLRFPYYDVEEEDKDEDEENETNFNKRASTYARTQTSSQSSDGATQRIDQNASYHETGERVAVTVKTIGTKTFCI